MDLFNERLTKSFYVAIMAESHRSARAGWQLAMIFGLAYAACAFGALYMTRNDFGIAHIWPASGVAFAGLLALRGRNRILLLAIIAIAGFLSNYTFGSSWSSALVFSVANIAEAFIAARFVCDNRLQCLEMDRPRWLLRFGIGALTAAVVSASLATGGFDAGANARIFASWMITVALGILLVGPGALLLFLRLSGTGEAIRITGTKLGGIALTAVITAIVSIITFGQGEYPNLFLPFIMLTFATVTLGLEGAITSVVVVAAIGSWLTARGVGPVMLIDTEQARTYFFQFYLLSLVVAALPVAMIVADTRRKRAELAESRDLLQSAAAIARMGHWRLDRSTGLLACSDEMYRIFGLSVEHVLTLDDLISAFHRDDRDAVRRAFDAADTGQDRFKIEVRLIAGNSKVKFVCLEGEAAVTPDDTKIVFGIMVDISERATLMQELRNAQRRAELKAREAIKAADTDVLTGLANRRRAMTFLEDAICDADAEQRRLSVILLDADHFKSINDSHGHTIGDEVLKAIAETCSKSLRPTDLFGRFGGEEFLAILPGADEKYARKIAERLRKTVAEIRIADCPEVVVTASLGVANYQPGVDVTYLLKAADAALYRAKNAGRNQFSIAA